VKKTIRDEWRVMVTLKPRRPADLGLTGIGEIAEFAAVAEPITVAVLPRRLGDLGWVSMGDRLASRDVEGDYRRRCEEIATWVRKLPHVVEAEVKCTETDVCSLCGRAWEVLTADEAADHSTNYDEHSVEGEPVCCDRAIDEFRAAQAAERQQREACPCGQDGCEFCDPADGGASA